MTITWAQGTTRATFHGMRMRDGTLVPPTGADFARYDSGLGSGMKPADFAAWRAGLTETPRWETA